MLTKLFRVLYPKCVKILLTKFVWTERLLVNCQFKTCYKVLHISIKMSGKITVEEKLYFLNLLLSHKRHDDPAPCSSWYGPIFNIKWSYTDEYQRTSVYVQKCMDVPIMFNVARMQCTMWMKLSVLLNYPYVSIRTWGHLSIILILHKRVFHLSMHSIVYGTFQWSKVLGKILSVSNRNSTKKYHKSCLNISKLFIVKMKHLMSFKRQSI